MGDGIMAIFGIENPSDAGATQALSAAAAVSQAVVELNRVHLHDIKEPLRIGIGIHTGEAILGRIGAHNAHGAGERITALGDTVNTASRLEALTKELGVECLASKTTLQNAGIKTAGLKLKTFKIRGREGVISGLPLKTATETAQLPTG